MKLPRSQNTATAPRPEFDANGFRARRAQGTRRCVDIGRPGEHARFIFVDEEQIRRGQTRTENLHPFAFGIPLGVDAGRHAKVLGSPQNIRRSGPQVVHTEDGGEMEVRRAADRKSWKGLRAGAELIQQRTLTGLIDQRDRHRGGSIGPHDSRSVHARRLEARDHGFGLGVTSGEGHDKGRDTQFAQGDDVLPAFPPSCWLTVSTRVVAAQRNCSTGRTRMSKTIFPQTQTLI